MTDQEKEQLTVLNAQFNDFIERYERDQERAQSWREKFEAKVVDCLYGNGKPGLVKDVALLQNTVWNIRGGLIFTIGACVLGGIGAFFTWAFGWLPKNG